MPRLTRMGLVLALLITSVACIEVQTLEDKRREECDEVVNAGAFVREYTVTTNCESERTVVLRVASMDYTEEEDSGAELGVAQFYRGLLVGDGSFLTRGEIRVPCNGSAAETTITFPASENNFVEYICPGTVGNGGSCLGTNAIGGQPAPANCTAGAN